MHYSGNLVFHVCVSVFLQVLNMGLGMLYAILACHWVVVKVTYFLRRYSLMLGHRVDACASHVMLCASCGCWGIAPDALRIILDVFCIVCDAWASFDACASCVEPGAPWVTEASSFAVFFFFFFYFAVTGFITLLTFYITGFCWIWLDLSHVGCWM